MDSRSTPGEGAPVQVSVVIPAYNEAEAIGGVIKEVNDAMSHVAVTYEILVVDDSSTDGTADVAAAKGARVVRRKIRGGSGASRKTGILNAHGEYIVHLDADGSYVAADIPTLLEYFPDYDQVNGARSSEQGSHPLLRIPAKWLIRKLASYLAAQKIPDLNTGLKAFKKSVMLRYLWVIPDGFSCVSSMTLAFLVNGHPVKYVPTGYRQRIGRSKFNPIYDTIEYMKTVLRMILYFRPLRVFLPIFMVLTGLGILLAVVNLITTQAIQSAEIMIFLTGMIFLAVGLLADLIVVQTRRYQ